MTDRDVLYKQADKQRNEKLRSSSGNSNRGRTSDKQADGWTDGWMDVDGRFTLIKIYIIIIGVDYTITLSSSSLQLKSRKEI